MALRGSAIVCQQRLNCSREGLHSPGRHVANQGVQIFIRLPRGARLRRFDGAWRSGGQPQASLQHADHRMVRLGSHGVGELAARVSQQSLTQAPLGQLEMVADVALLNDGPFATVALIQIAAAELDCARFDLDFAMGPSNVIDLADAADLTLDDTPVSQQQKSLLRHGPQRSRTQWWRPQ